VNIASQIAAVKASQGARAIEQRMLGEAFCGPPAPTSSPGTNTTMQLELAGGEIVFHKPFSGVDIANAIAFGQTNETPPLHEAVAWQLAAVLGPPWQELVAPCVLRDHAGEDGSLSLRASGWPRDAAPTLNPTWCLPAAFFDSLIAQQDRHDGNWRWDGERLTLIDHGYTFALPGAVLNYRNSRGQPGHPIPKEPLHDPSQLHNLRAQPRHQGVDRATRRAAHRRRRRREHQRAARRLDQP
jgi:hypothetical protein